MNRVQICSAAATDFTESLCWYAERSPELALQFESEIDGALSRISDSPDRFPAFDDRHRYLQMRRFPYLIIYRQHGNTTTIIAVAHTSRAPGFWRDR